MRYSKAIIISSIFAFAAGISCYGFFSEKIAPLKLENSEDEIVDSCYPNPLSKKYREMEKRYEVDLSFADCVFNKKGKGDIPTFPFFDLPLNSLDVLFIGDSSIAWGLSPEAVSQISGLNVGAFMYEGMLLTKANMPIYEAIANCVLKDTGRVVLSFTPQNQSQAAAELTTVVMKPYQQDLRLMLRAIRENRFCETYFAPRKNGVVISVHENSRKIVADDGVQYLYSPQTGLKKMSLTIGDKVSFRPVPIKGEKRAVSVTYEGKHGDFGLQSGVINAYAEEVEHGSLKNKEGQLFFINPKTKIQPSLSLNTGEPVEFYAYQMKNKAMAYDVFKPSEADWHLQEADFTEKLMHILQTAVSFKGWQKLLDEQRAWLRINWKMDLPNIDFYGYRVERYINPEWHRVKNQFDESTQTKIQWGDDTISLYGTSFSELAPQIRVKNFYQDSPLANPVKANSQAVLDWSERQDIVYMLPLSLIGELNTPPARNIFMKFYQNKLGLLDMHSHFIENDLPPVLMQFGHHPANEGGMVQSLEIGKLLKELTSVENASSISNVQYELLPKQ